MVDALTKRRFDGNTDNWSLKMPTPKHSNRTVSTRSLRGLEVDSLRSNANSLQIASYKTHNLKSLNELAELSPVPKTPPLNSANTPSPHDDINFSLPSQPIPKTKCGKLKHIYSDMKTKMKDTITDQWRRATQSGNDPYVKISLKPTPTNGFEDSFETRPILGGGSHVGFNPFYDNAQHTFLCHKDIDTLKHKYLKIEVFDVEAGTADRMIGTAHLILKHFKNHMGQTIYYAAIPLYGSVDTNYQWSGTVEIHVTFHKIGMTKANLIKDKLANENKAIAKKGVMGRLSHKINQQLPIHRLRTLTRDRSATDQIMLARAKSVDGATKQRLEEQAMNKQREKEEAALKEKEQTNARIIQGFVVNLVLFISLVLSGTLFLGSMNIYEVDAQSIYFKDNFAAAGDTFSVIDSFRFSIVTVTTIGYGDCYPQTTGGRIFGTFMIIFGVSLLARLLNSVLDRAAADYEELRLRRITNRRAVTHDSMHEFDIDGDGVITSYEFLRTMLLRREDTTVEVIDEIMELFDSYDADGSGEIEVAEIQQLIKQKQGNNEGAVEMEDKKEIEINENDNDSDSDYDADIDKLMHVSDRDKQQKENKSVSYSDDITFSEDDGTYYDYNNNKAIELNKNNYYHNVIDDFYWKIAKARTKKKRKKKSKKTFSDSLFKFMRKKGIENIKNITQFMANEEYDTDAFLQDIWDIYNENHENNSNIMHQIKDESIANDVINTFESFEYALTVRVVGCDNLSESDSACAAEDSFWLFMKGWLGFIAYLVIGAMIFSFVEDANFGDMLWFAVVTTCTVGYGDARPVTTIGRILNAFFIAVSVVLFVSVFSTTFDYIYARQEALVKQKATNKKTIANMVKKFPVLEDALKKREFEENENKMNKKIEDEQIKQIPSKITGDIENGTQENNNLSGIDENEEVMAQAQHLELNDKNKEWID